MSERSTYYLSIPIKRAAFCNVDTGFRKAKVEGIPGDACVELEIRDALNLEDACRIAGEVLTELIEYDRDGRIMKHRS